MKTRHGSVLLGILALALGAAIAGCEGDDPSDIRSYTDSAGRSCTVDLHSITEEATCDASPAPLAMCTGGQEAVFVLHTDFDFDTRIYTLESCAACIDRPARMTFISSTGCATVDCDADMDCMLLGYTCQSGICRRTGS